MRDILVKLYVDEEEHTMINELAVHNDLSVNRYLRRLLCIKRH